MPSLPRGERYETAVRQAKHARSCADDARNGRYRSPKYRAALRELATTSMGLALCSLPEVEMFAATRTDWLMELAEYRELRDRLRANGHKTEEASEGDNDER